MKKILFLLMLVSSFVLAADQRVENMVANCQKVMDKKVCRVDLDKRDFKPGAKIFMAGVGEVFVDDYISFKNSGEDMCNFIRRACAESYDSGVCRVARGSFSPRSVNQ